MLNALALYIRYVLISMRGQMQYRASLVMTTIGNLLLNAGEMVAIAVLFERFGNLRGWRLPEVGLFYGLVHMAFAVAQTLTRGFDSFAMLVKRGDFDRLLVRPRSTALQVAASEVRLMRLGRFVQGLAVLLWASHALGLGFRLAAVGLIAATVVGGACLFSGLFILQATLSFWTVETLEMVNIVTFGSSDAAQYPLPIYRRWFQWIFTLLVPVATVSYFPGLALLGRGDAAFGVPSWFCWCAPLVGVAFLALALQIWKLGVRHYRSTGN